jgi:hypothetical protein
MLVDEPGKVLFLGEKNVFVATGAYGWRVVVEVVVMQAAAHHISGLRKN